MKIDKRKVIYANGKTIKFYWLVAVILTVIFMASSIAAFVCNIIVVGILSVVGLVLVWSAMGIVLSNKKVVFYNNYFVIPKEYVTKDRPFSKTVIKYAGLTSISYLMPDQADDDCTGLHGGKVPCIKFIDNNGEVYRMKVENFSEKQILSIIDEVKRHAGIN